MSEFSVAQTQPKQQPADDCLKCRVKAGFANVVQQQPNVKSKKSTIKTTAKKPAKLSNEQPKLEKLRANLTQKEIILNKASEYNYCIQNETEQKTSSTNKANASKELAKAQAAYDAALKAVNEAESIVTITAIRQMPFTVLAPVITEEPIGKSDIDELRNLTTEQFNKRLEAARAADALKDASKTTTPTQVKEPVAVLETKTPSSFTLHSGIYVAGNVTINAQGATGSNIGLNNNSINGDGNKQFIGPVQPDEAQETLGETPNKRRTYIGVSAARVGGKNLSAISTWGAGQSAFRTFIDPGYQVGVAVGTTLDKKGNWTGEIFGNHSVQKFGASFKCGCEQTGEIVQNQLGLGAAYTIPTNGKVKPYIGLEGGLNSVSTRGVESRDATSVTYEPDGKKLNVFANAKAGIDYVNTREDGRENFRLGAFAAMPLMNRVETRTGATELYAFTPEPIFGIRAQFPLSQTKQKSVIKPVASPAPVLSDDANLLNLEVGQHTYSNLTPKGEVYETVVDNTYTKPEIYQKTITDKFGNNIILEIQVRENTVTKTFEKLDAKGNWVKFDITAYTKKAPEVPKDYQSNTL